MGYYTTFKLTWAPTPDHKNRPNCKHNPKTPFCPTCGTPRGTSGVNETVTTFLAKHAEQYYGVDQDGNSRGTVKWYDYIADMTAMSKEIPNVLFKLHGVGEENGDIWDAYFLNGKHQIHKAKIIIDEVDPKGWK